MGFEHGLDATTLQRASSLLPEYFELGYMTTNGTPSRQTLVPASTALTDH